MQLTNLLPLALLAAVQIGAVPVAEPGARNLNPTNALFKRADIRTVSCGPDDNQRAYTVEDVKDSFDALMTNQNLPRPKRPTAGTRYYPQQYDAKDADVIAALNAISECKTGQTDYKYFEFPLKSSVFNGGPERSQGPDRVIGIGKSPGRGLSWTLTYCLSMTHRGGVDANDSSFRPCTH